MVTRLVLVLLLASALVVGCGGEERKRAAKAPPKAQLTGGEGRLVDIGGGRSLYLECVGSGGPAVVLEAGSNGSTNNWSAVQPQLGGITRTCAYDRAGLGNSLPIPGVHDAGDEVADLHRLLEHARIPPPYVLVGHSYGGLIVRLFAHTHPQETAGVVLVDAMGQDEDRRLLRIRRAAPARVRHLLPTFKAVENGVNVRAGEALEAKVKTLGDTPVAVITRGSRGDDQLPPQVRRAVARLWTRMQDEQAALSTDHVHVVALRSGHFVQSFAEGQPNVVIRAVRAVVQAARTHTHLPPCPRLFHGSGTRCRG